MNNFENLLIWKEGVQLATSIYKLLKDCKDFALKDQMQRAVISVPSNIAEGYERDSEKEFIRFLRIAKGSLGELRTQLQIAMNVEVLSKQDTDFILKDCVKLSRMIQKFINFRSQNISNTNPPTH